MQHSSHDPSLTCGRCPVEVAHRASLQHRPFRLTQRGEYLVFSGVFVLLFALVLLGSWLTGGH